MVNIEYVTVGNPGNLGQAVGAGAGGYGPDAIVGAVPYVYKISKYEVTSGQYTEFLNAVADTDTYGLYTPAMATWCGIAQTGSSGSYNYSVSPDWANRPVLWVSRWDASRFANWIHNGQPTGLQNASTTEDGAYQLLGYNDYQGNRPHKPNASVWLPTEDEWHKAAYYNPATSSYWEYATRSNSLPSNDFSALDPGNTANFNNKGSGSVDDFMLGPPYWTTPVGEFENSGSAYGTFDQSGNVFEWTESLVGFNDNSIRGGSADSPGLFLQARARPLYNSPTSEHSDLGFRLAAVPEPSAICLVLAGLAAASIFRKFGVARRQPR